jgi:hypothetical protein
MKLRKMFFMFVLVFLLVAPAAVAGAGDFDWTGNLNIRAEADLSGFRGRLATRFKVGAVEIDAVLRNAESPADAYLILRLGELSARSTDYVIDQYRREKSRGWGALAKSLGIKPGSREFHALKRGDDLYADNGDGQQNGKGKGKGKK